PAAAEDLPARAGHAGPDGRAAWHRGTRVHRTGRRASGAPDASGGPDGVGRFTGRPQSSGHDRLRPRLGLGGAGGGALALRGGGGAGGGQPSGGAGGGEAPRRGPGGGGGWWGRGGGGGGGGGGPPGGRRGGDPRGAASPWRWSGRASRSGSCWTRHERARPRVRAAARKAPDRSAGAPGGRRALDEG